MLKPNKLNIGDKVAIVSLSNGILGEKYCEHQLKIGVQRLENMGLKPIFMPNSLKSKDFLAQNPEQKAQDLFEAFNDKEIKAIICAIGGFDTYQTLPFLLENEKFKDVILKNPKIFIGYSDSTINHLMFYQLGLQTYYGHSFLVDFAELEDEMLNFTKSSFLKLFFQTEPYLLSQSNVWYDERTDFSHTEIGIKRKVHLENKGPEFFRGQDIIKGNLLGGCLDTIFGAMIGKNFSDQKKFVINIIFS